MPIVTRTCPACDESFTYSHMRGSGRIYCDRCGTVGKKRAIRPTECPVCDTTFLPECGRQKYCSHDCRKTKLEVQRQQRRLEAANATDKHCSRCDRRLPLTAFRKDRSRVDGLYPYCIECWRTYTGTRGPQRKSKWSSKAEYNAWYLANRKDYLENQYWSRYLWTTYRMTEDQYNTMLEQQGGRCAICRTDKAGHKRGRSNGRFSVDHDHSCCDTYTSCGKCIRGLLCHACNTGIGFLRDNPKILRAAIKYVTAPPGMPSAESEDEDCGGGGEQLALIG